MKVKSRFNIDLFIKDIFEVYELAFINSQKNQQNEQVLIQNAYEEVTKIIAIANKDLQQVKLKFTSDFVTLIEQSILGLIWKDYEDMFWNQYQIQTVTVQVDQFLEQIKKYVKEEIPTLVKLTNLQTAAVDSLVYELWGKFHLLIQKFNKIKEKYSFYNLFQPTNNYQGDWKDHCFTRYEEPLIQHNFRLFLSLIRGDKERLYSPFRLDGIDVKLIPDIIECPQPATDEGLLMFMDYIERNDNISISHLKLFVSFLCPKIDSIREDLNLKNQMMFVAVT